MATAVPSGGRVHGPGSRTTCTVADATRRLYTGRSTGPIQDVGGVVEARGGRRDVHDGAPAPAPASEHAVELRQLRQGRMVDPGHVGEHELGEGAVEVLGLVAPTGRLELAQQPA